MELMNTTAIAGIGHNHPKQIWGRKAGQENRKRITNKDILANLKSDTCVAENLWLVVKGGRGRSWVYVKKHQLTGRFKLGLGSYPEVSLTDAKKKVMEFNSQLAAGIDPRKPVVVHRFRDVLPLWIEKAKPSWTSERYAKSVPVEIERYILPYLGDLDVNKITPADVVDCLMGDVGVEDQPFWFARHVTAYRCKGFVREIIGYAMGMGYRKMGSGNPAAWEDCLVHLLADPKKIHAPKPFPSVHHSEIRAFMGALRSLKGMRYRCLEALIQAGLRTQEAMGAMEGEIDFTEATWTIPAARTKKRKEHIVPLSQELLAIFKALHRGDGGLVFGELDAEALRDATMDVMTKAGRKFVDRQSKEIAVPHGFRSSMATWMADQDVNDGLIDLCLAHVVGSEVLRRYQRSDKADLRRDVMQRWSAHLAG